MINEIQQRESLGEMGFGRAARREEGAKIPLRLLLRLLVSGASYYLATQLAWNLCFSHTKVSLFFPPYAVLIAILLLVPAPRWWAYVLVTASAHLLAAFQAHWPLSFALHSEVFDMATGVVAAAGLRFFVESPLKLATLREAIIFVLVAAVIVPFGTAFWGAGLTLSYHYGTDYWVEWRKLGIANGVTAIVLVPAIHLAVSRFSSGGIKLTRAQWLEAGILGTGLLVVGVMAFDTPPAGPETTPALLYAPIPFLVWAALRFGVAGTCTSTLLITVLAIGGAMRGRGPFLAQTPEENALALQLFLSVTATPLLFLSVVIDQERGMQSSLRESEARFRTVADTAPVMIWMSGTDKLCTFFNKGWLGFTGRTLEEERGNGWAAGVHLEDFDRCLEVYTRSFDARRPFEMEYRLRRSDGEYHWILDKGTPRFSAEGVFLGFIGSCIDIAERKLAEEAAHALSGRLIQAQERARAQLARELHDDLNQSLALLSVELEMFGRNLPAEPAKIAAQLEKFSNHARKLSSEVHQLSHELHPAKLDQLGLVAALRGFCDEFTLVHEMAIHFIERDVPWFTPDDTALCLYRITQEALHNVVKHSGGTEATVEITFEDGQLRLTIADDGAGFDQRAARAAGSLGLVSIGERVRYAGGHLAIDSRPGAGTRVEVLVPLLEQSRFFLADYPERELETG